MQRSQSERCSSSGSESERVVSRYSQRISSQWMCRNQGPVQQPALVLCLAREHLLHSESPLTFSLSRSPELLSKYSIPPHDSPGDEHGSGRKSSSGPDKFRRLVAHAGTIARNTDPIDAAEMQIGQPIADAIYEARGEAFSRRLEPVEETLKCLRKAEVHAAQSEQHDDAESPEAEHAMQFPHEATPSHISVNNQTLLPRLDSRPPNKHTRERQGDGQEP